MCEFCIKHGEGKKWYEVVENYSQEMLADPNRQAYIADFVLNIRNNANTSFSKLEWTKRKLPLAYRFIRKMGSAHMKKHHYGQVIPLEDALKVVDLVQSITRIACICRSITTGKNDARFCLLLGIDPTGLIKDWPELQKNLETLTKEDTKELLRQFDNEGLVHSIWTFKTPYIGAICNCDHDCLAYKIQCSTDLMNIMFKAEYICEINGLQCVGCRNCLKLCQFGAIEYSSFNLKCYINPLKCYGCGVCRQGCKKKAISLLDKGDFGHLKNLW